MFGDARLRLLTRLASGRSIPPLSVPKKKSPLNTDDFFMERDTGIFIAALAAHPGQRQTLRLLAFVDVRLRLLTCLTSARSIPAQAMKKAEQVGCFHGAGYGN